MKDISDKYNLPPNTRVTKLNSGVLRFYNLADGVYPFWQYEQLKNIREKYSTIAAWVGRAGVGKTYAAIQNALCIDPTFSLDQVAMTHTEILDNMDKLREGQLLVIDEPQELLSKHTWWDKTQQLVGGAIKTGRFRVIPIHFVVINVNWLDKLLREDMVNYVIEVRDRGSGIVYRPYRIQRTDQTGWDGLGEVYLDIPNGEDCRKSWCMTCSSFKKPEGNPERCELLRANYERKRITIQNERLTEARVMVKRGLEAEQSSADKFDETLKYAIENYSDLLDKKGRLSTEKIRIETGSTVGLSMRVKRYIDNMSPEDRKSNELPE